jgi:hypothetical protein
MTSFEDFYIQCNCCEAWLIGKTPKVETVSQSLLYSDGMIINDLIPANPQKLVLCPACGKFFWILKENCLEAIPEIDQVIAYPWTSWRFFGCNLLDNRGRKALINQYWQSLELMKPLSQQQEIWIRQSLLWAYNDLYRDAERWRFSDLLKGRVSLRYLLNSRLFNKEGVAYFESEKKRIEANVLALINLYEQDEASEPAMIAELYREIGNFVKAAEILRNIIRKTHYINMLNKCVQAGNRAVFKVAG